MKKTLVILGMIFSLVSCSQDDASVDTETEATSAEDAISSIGSSMDDENNSSYAFNSKATIMQRLDEILFPRAYAASCVRPINEACVAGVKSAQFDDCSVYGSRATLSGEVTLDYSTADCSLNNDGDEVLRTFDYSFNGPRGGQLNVTSEDRENYEGEVIGGGGQLTNTASGYEVEIFGKHKIFSKNQRVFRDHSIRTLIPLSVTGGLSRATRQVTNGQVEVSHNLAKFKAVYTATNLQWSDSCCHPVSGTLSVEYSGSKTGSGQIEFNSCDDVELTRDGVIQDVEFTYCE